MPFINENIHNTHAKHSVDDRHAPDHKNQKAYFSFHIRSGETNAGLPGAVFELISYHKGGRHVGLSNRDGKVSFLAIIDEAYVLVEKAPPDDYVLNLDTFTVCLKKDGLYVNGIKEDPFVVYNYHHDHRFTIAYHADYQRSAPFAFSLPHGAPHAIINERQAGALKEGYAFFAWCKSPDGNGPLYFPGDTLPVKENVHFYAQWMPIPSLHAEEGRSPRDAAP